MVVVAPGTYTGPDNRNLDLEGKEIVVRSAAGAESTFIDCEGLSRGFHFVTGETRATTVQGFTILNGYSDRGGAIYLHASSPTIRECVFTANTAGSVGGGAIFCDYVSSPSIQDCGFYDNTASAIGGAIRSSFASPEIFGCTFVRNTASLGSGVACNGSTFTLSNSVIAFGNLGAAVHCAGVGVPDVFHNCVFANAGGDTLCGSCHDNLFVDPLFCGLAVRDLTLCANSPCTPGGNIWGERIGAYGVGCADCSVSPVEFSFHAAANVVGSVTLRWTVGDLGSVGGFNIYRSSSADGVFSMVNDELLPATSPGEFEDDTVWPGSTFWYQLVPVLLDGSEDEVSQAPISVTTGGRLVLALHPPRPNPFRGETSVAFDIPSGVRRARVAVYNVKGQLVRELYAGAPEPGRRTVLWNGLDVHDKPASSGVYFVMLETDVAAETRKLLLVK
jgi:predicted outer membrane repeat protein